MGAKITKAELQHLNSIDLAVRVLRERANTLNYYSPQARAMQTAAHDLVTLLEMSEVRNTLDYLREQRKKQGYEF